MTYAPPSNVVPLNSKGPKPVTASLPSLPPIAPTAALVEATEELRAILSYARPHKNPTETLFMRHYVDGLASLYPVETDGFGNRWIKVPGVTAGMPNVLWSCHVDTMDQEGGFKGIGWGADGKTLCLKKRKPGRCLGADDGAGVWVLREMIKAGVPGTYVFHRGEEVGRLGSKYVRDHEPKRLIGHDACIAFDRRGASNIITFQMGERGCSKEFAATFALAILEASDGRLVYAADPTGSYTDSYSYFDHIPECTNVSIGYQGEHGPRETLDAAHVVALRDAMVAIDLKTIAIRRDPSVVEYEYSGYGRSSFGYGTYGGWGADDLDPNEVDPLDWPGSAKRSAEVFEGRPWAEGLHGLGAPDGDLADEAEDPLVALVRQHPEVAASLLYAFGADVDDMYDELDAMRSAGGR